MNNPTNFGTIFEEWFNGAYPQHSENMSIKLIAYDAWVAALGSIANPNLGSVAKDPIDTINIKIIPKDFKTFYYAGHGGGSSSGSDTFKPQGGGAGGSGSRITDAKFSDFIFPTKDTKDKTKKDDQ